VTSHEHLTQIVTAALNVRNSVGDANAKAAWLLIEDGLRRYGSDVTPRRRPEYCTETYEFPCTMPLCAFHGDSM
jgi:hypothetical protein